MTAMHTLPLLTPLVEPHELAALIGPDADVAIIDCRHDLARPQWGAESYAAGHIPGAAFAHLDRTLSGPLSSTSGRHPLPATEQLAATIGGWGIGPQTRAVAYDQGSGAIAARLWWLLRFLGHSRAAVLDGGFAAWEAAGLPVTREAATRRPRR
ncbi:MAG: sulfurtransferase, partial [Steroidobacteraceae bacterium]